MSPDEIVFMTRKCSDGGYVIRAIGFSIFTQCDSLDVVDSVIAEAILCHFDEEKAYRILLVENQDEI